MPDQPPLSEAEIIELRRILDEEAKRKWLWELMRKSAVAVFATAAALVAFRDDIRDLFGWIFSK